MPRRLRSSPRHLAPTHSAPPIAVVDPSCCRIRRPQPRPPLDPVPPPRARRWRGEARRCTPTKRRRMKFLLRTTAFVAVEPAALGPSTVDPAGIGRSPPISSKRRRPSPVRQLVWVRAPGTSPLPLFVLSPSQFSRLIVDGIRDLLIVDGFVCCGYIALWMYLCIAAGSGAGRPGGRAFLFCFAKPHQCRV